MYLGKMVNETVTEQLKDLSLDTVINIKDNIIGFINELISGIAPVHPTWFVFTISVLIGIVVKRWQKWDWIPTIFTILLIYFSLRWIGIP